MNETDAVKVDALTAEDVASAARSDVNHLVQPVIGTLRLRQHKEEELTDRDIDYFIDRLLTVLDLADTFGDREKRDALAGRHGLGYGHYAEENKHNDERFRAILRGGTA